MERITADELRNLALFEHSGVVLRGAIDRAAYTIEEMDKDAAVYEQQIVDMQRQHCQEREERVGG